MNEIIRNLTIQRLRNFVLSFDETKKVFWDEAHGRLRHSGEFGTYREELVKKWLRVVVPERFGISSGFVVNSTGAISTQCDIIIYDRTTTPSIENLDNQRFFPVETVICIGEVKSDLNSIGELNDCLVKLAQIKSLRQGVQDPVPYYPKPNAQHLPHLSPFDHVFSFLICKRFNFQFDHTRIDYGAVDMRYWHNIVLSLDDGALNYNFEGAGAGVWFPFAAKTQHAHHFVRNDNAELPAHIVLFLTALRMAVTVCSMLEIDMVHYLTDNISRHIPVSGTGGGMDNTS